MFHLLVMTDYIGAVIALLTTDLYTLLLILYIYEDDDLH